MLNTTSESFFESMYRASDDPWNFAVDTYEQSRYDALMRCLEGRHFHRALEPGCSVGVLTERLAAICDHVEAFDISTTAAARAAARCAGRQNVHVKQGSLRDRVPPGCDLLVLSEIGYYFSKAELVEVLTPVIDGLEAAATIIACHWLGHSPDHILHGDEVHEVLGTLGGLARTRSERYTGFRLDVWQKAEAQA